MPERVVEHFVCCDQHVHDSRLRCGRSGELGRELFAEFRRILRQRQRAERQHVCRYGSESSDHLVRLVVMRAGVVASGDDVRVRPPDGIEHNLWSRVRVIRRERVDGTDVEVVTVGIGNRNRSCS